jgi:predicted RNase H-like nuclease (RuvC/YqgF family)
MTEAEAIDYLRTYYVGAKSKHRAAIEIVLSALDQAVRPGSEPPGENDEGKVSMISYTEVIERSMRGEVGEGADRITQLTALTQEISRLRAALDKAQAEIREQVTRAENAEEEGAALAGRVRTLEAELAEKRGLVVDLTNCLANRNAELANFTRRT